MSKPGGSHSIGSIAFLSSPEPLAPGRPNWAYACRAMLESRGYRISVFSSISGLLAARAEDFQAVFAGPLPGQGLTTEALSALAKLPCPVFLEAGALAPDAVAALGLEPAGLPEHPRINWEDQVVLGALEPFRGFIGTEGWPSHPLEPARLATKYVAPSPDRFAIGPAEVDPPAEVRRKLALKRAFSWRLLLAKNDPPDPATQAARSAVLGLAAAAARIEPSSHRKALAEAADRALYLGSRRPGEEATPDLDIARELLAVAATNKVLEGGACARLCLKALAALPAVRKAIALLERRPGTLHEKIEELRAMDRFAVMLVLAARERHAEADAVFAGLCGASLDREKGVFADANAEGRLVGLSHPIVGLALICQERAIECEDAVRSLRDGLAEQPGNLCAWLHGPETSLWRPENERDVTVLARVSGAGGAEPIPGIWRVGRVTVFGYPALSTIGHAWTLPDVDEPLHSSSQHWIFLLEHAVMATVMRQPNGPAQLIIRHDVDRPLSDESFSEILALYAERGVAASWYWIHSRLRPAQMRQLVEAGHEVGLHLVHNADRTAELAAVNAACSDSVIGETYHGAGADFHYGAVSAVRAVASGIRYSELHPFQYGVIATSIGVLMADSNLRLTQGCCNVTFAYSTDSTEASRKFEVAGDTAFALGLLEAGYTVCVLNHPDLNRDRLIAFLDAAAERGAKVVTAAEAVSALRRVCR